MIQLHYYPSTAAMVPHIVLEEIGVPYQRVLVDRMQNAHKTPDYLRLNPNGLIPVLVDGDLVLYETAAICLHLCDTHPEAGLVPPLGTAERAHFYKWLMWLTNTLQAIELGAPVDLVGDDPSLARQPVLADELALLFSSEDEEFLFKS